MSADPKVMNEVLRCLEAAADRAATKGAKAEDIVRGMLRIYVSTRLGSGADPGVVFDEVAAAINEFHEAVARGVKVEKGPPLGDGDN